MLEGKGANQEAAEAARNLGALAFYDNTQEALAAYRRAVELDPENMEVWNQLGGLLLRVGPEAAFGKVKAIAEARNDRVVLAVAYGNLGVVYKVRGDLGQAEAMYKKALDIDETLGRKEGMADAYVNLGIVYTIRRDLGQAEAIYKKALDINAALGRKKEMASAYANLGNVYAIRGDLGQAEAMYKKALALFYEVGASAQAQQTQQMLDSAIGVRKKIEEFISRQR